METVLTHSLPVGLEMSLWNNMPPDAQRALLSAETILTLKISELDYGLAVIGYFKAIEITLEDRVLKRFRNYVLGESGADTTMSFSAYQDGIAAHRSRMIQALREIIRDPHIDVERNLTLAEEYTRSLEQIENEYDQAYRLHNYIYQGKSLTLVGMVQILQYLKRVGDETRFGLLWSLKKFIKQHYTRGHRFWSIDKQLAIRLESVVLADRNPAAHVEVYSRERALAVRIKILGDQSREGILVSILKALA